MVIAIIFTLIAQLPILFNDKPVDIVSKLYFLKVLLKDQASLKKLFLSKITYL